jgi:hypothetical protein
MPVPLGYRLNEATKRRMSMARKRLWTDPAFRKKAIAAMTRKFRTAEYRRKQSCTRRKLWKSQGYKKKQSLARRGLYKLRSKQMRDRWADPLFRRKWMRRWQKLTAQRCGERMRRLWKGPKYRAGMLEKFKVLRRDPEFRKAVGQRTSQAWKALTPGEKSARTKGLNILVRLCPNNAEKKP